MTSEFANGYECAISDIVSHLESGGIESAVEWITNMGSPETVQKLQNVKLWQNDRTHSPYVAQCMKHHPDEVKIVRKIVRTFKNHDNPIVEIFDGEDYLSVFDLFDVEENIFNLEDVKLIPLLGGWIRLVFGNSPSELICDYTTSLDKYMPEIESYCEKFE